MTTNTGYHRNVWSLSFFLHFPVYNFFHVRLRAGKRCEVNRFTEAKVYPCSSRRCKLRPFGFCRKSPRLCFAQVVFFEKKLTSTKHFPSYSLRNTVTSTGSAHGAKLLIAGAETSRDFGCCRIVISGSSTRRHFLFGHFRFCVLLVVVKTDIHPCRNPPGSIKVRPIKINRRARCQNKSARQQQNT